MTFKKTKVVMLPTNQKTDITFLKHPNKEKLQIPVAEVQQENNLEIKNFILKKK